MIICELIEHLLGIVQNLTIIVLEVSCFGDVTQFVWGARGGVVVKALRYKTASQPLPEMSARCISWG